MSDRARRMSPDDRRSSIVDAATDLIRRTGAAPTSKAIAEAAGVAEGTVFRSYPTMEALTDAVVGAVVCPVLFDRALDEVDPALPLPDRLTAGVGLLMRRFEEIHSVIGPLALTSPPRHHPHPHCPDPDVSTTMQGGPSPMTRLLDPDADALRFDVADVVLALRMLAFAGSHTHLTPHRLADPGAIVDLVLDGARCRDTAPPADRERSPAHRARPPSHDRSSTPAAAHTKESSC